MTRSKGREARRWAVQIVNVQDPPITSAAQLVLMAKEYSTQDKTIYTEYRMHRIRTRWMKLQLTQPDLLGGLTCVHCGKMGLQPFKSNKDQQAVLDHKKELALGGDWRDPNNFQVLCHSCNGKKNDKFRETFLHSDYERRHAA